MAYLIRTIRGGGPKGSVASLNIFDPNSPDNSWVANLDYMT